MKAFPHRWHSNGLSPVWLLMCIWSLAGLGNALPQVPQGYLKEGGLGSPTIICNYKLIFQSTEISTKYVDNYSLVTTRNIIKRPVNNCSQLSPPLKEVCRLFIWAEFLLSQGVREINQDISLHFFLWTPNTSNFINKMEAYYSVYFQDFNTTSKMYLSLMGRRNGDNT